MISANNPRLPKITVVEHGFSISERSPVPEGIPLAGSSPSYQAAKNEGDLGLSEEEFRAFDQADPSENPSGDLGDPDLSEAELLSVGTFSRAVMGLKRKPPPAYSTSLRVNRGKVHKETRNPVFQLPHPSPSPSRLDLPLLSRSHNLPVRNFLLLFNQLCLLGLSPLIQRERGVPRVRNQWMGGNPNPLRKGTKPCELESS